MSRSKLIVEIILNGLLPWAVFRWLTEARHWSEYHALVAITVIPSVIALVEFLRHRRLDAIAITSLVSILIGLAMTAMTSDVRLLQIRESYLTLVVGLVFLISGLVGKPVMYFMARAQMKQLGKSERFERDWEQQPDLRRYLKVVTTFWGITLLAEFAAKLWLIENFPMAQVLAWSPFALYGILAVAMAWTLLYSRAYRHRRLAALPPEPGFDSSTVQASPTEFPVRSRLEDDTGC